MKRLAANSERFVSNRAPAREFAERVRYRNDKLKTSVAGLINKQKWFTPDRMEKHQMDETPIGSPRLTSLQIGGVMALGIGSTLIIALQPILLGAMMQDDRLGTAQLGQAAAAELAGMVLLSTLAGARFRPKRLRVIAFAAVLLALVANLATMMGSGIVIIAARFVSGCSSGVLIWLLAGMLARVAAPERLVGIYYAAQSILQLTLAALCSQILVPRLGGSGAYGCLLVLNLVMVGLCFLLPSAYAPLQAAPYRPSLPTRTAWAGLAAVAVFMAGMEGLWVYVPALLGNGAMPVWVAKYTIDAGLASQILSGALVAALGRWVGYRSVLSLAALGGITVAALLGLHAPAIACVGAGAAFGLVWVLSASYQVPFLLAADPSGRTIMFMMPAQLLGCALGPLIASLTVSGRDAHAAVVVSASCFALSFLLLWGVHLCTAALRAPVAARS
jgi:hypothetical protein